MSPKLAILEMRTFSGRVFGASHWFGTIWCDGKEFPLEYELSITRARAMNKSQNYADDGNSCEDSSWRWEGGMKCNAFFSEDEVKEAAKKAWKSQFPSAKILLAGMGWAHCNCGPQEPIDCATGYEETLAEMKQLYTQDGEVNNENFYDKVATEKIHKEWKELVKSL